MSMGKGEKPILSVRIDADLLEAVDAMAEKADCGRAEIVERCPTWKEHEDSKPYGFSSLKDTWEKVDAAVRRRHSTHPEQEMEDVYKHVHGYTEQHLL